jgi:hypothetical protein
MQLDERDTITTDLIRRILCSGMARLTPIQQELIGALFLHKIKAPMRFFKSKFGMSSGDVHAQLGVALVELRRHFEHEGITCQADFCIDDRS